MVLAYFLSGSSTSSHTATAPPCHSILLHFQNIQIRKLLISKEMFSVRVSLLLPRTAPRPFFHFILQMLSTLINQEGREEEEKWIRVSLVIRMQIQTQPLDSQKKSLRRQKLTLGNKFEDLGCRQSPGELWRLSLPCRLLD